MAITTYESAVAQLTKVRGDYQTLVRDRRTTARAMLAEADAQLPIIREADAEAVTYLTTLGQAAGTSAALKARIAGLLAEHALIKSEQAQES